MMKQNWLRLCCKTILLSHPPGVLPQRLPGHQGAPCGRLGPRIRRYGFHTPRCPPSRCVAARLYLLQPLQILVLQMHPEGVAVEGTQIKTNDTPLTRTRSLVFGSLNYHKAEEKQFRQPTESSAPLYLCNFKHSCCCQINTRITQGSTEKCPVPYQICELIVVAVQPRTSGAFTCCCTVN